MTSSAARSLGQGRLGPDSHGAALDAMAVRQLDVLVVGGGVVGAGVALDAVTRGLSVGLVERDDWAAGASSVTRLLVHGGLRHLEQLDLRAARTALHERGLLLEFIAPHLVQRVPLLHPLRGHVPERLYVGSGLGVYDALSHVPGQRRALPAHRHLTRRSVRRIAPGLNFEGLTGGVQFWEGQVDDARFVLTLVRTAAAYGALVANGAEVTGLTQEDGVVTGAWVRDSGGGRERHLRAKVVVGATGPTTAGLAPADLGVFRPTPAAPRRGVHLVVPRQRIRSTSGLVVGRGSQAVVILPWGRHWIIGTAPRARTGGRAAVTAADVADVLAAANGHLSHPLASPDVEAAYAGTWPTDAGAARPIVPLRPGLVLVASGAATGLTTYRLLAQHAVDVAVGQLGGLVAECVTPRLPLLGADGYHARWNQRHLLARQAGLHVVRVEHLLRRYGSLADQVLDLIRTDAALGRPVAGAEDYLGAEALYAVTHEGARHLEDILARRTRTVRETRDGGRVAAPHVARLVAGPLGWDEATTSREISRFLHRADRDLVPEQ